ncbi:Oar protein [Acidisarcina polymorpha]|uniref:Oar protein n=1 Tax=Acidisarcina polymorpha TaxID=2211140 RepID=A0A2Z5FXU2_9BACT|nr:TonB-dependent receptor [Acidisarcina polymorpha]AXC11709.1 Oar protein [Acidisarcina polymorpha]
MNLIQSGLTSKKTKWWCGCLIAVCLSLCTGTVARAQSSASGAIRGSVTDPTGAVIPEASVSVVNVDTGEEKLFTTNKDGLYDTVSTPHGQYRVTITAPGFEALVLGPITLDIGTITLNGHMSMGSQFQRVVVTTDTAALLHTESGEQSTTFDEKTMLQLPQVGQDWANFTILLPGSAGASSANGVTTPGAAVSLNGSMPYSGNFLSDGGSVTNPHSADVETDTFDTVAEVDIEDSNFSAQYGIGGVVFNQITKGGTNQFHGSAYEHFQNDALNARSYFNAPDQRIPPLKFNQFGGSIGGPFWRNKMFFFFNYDKSIDNQSYTNFASMPTDALKGVNTANGQFDLTQLMPLDGNGNKLPVTDSNGNNIINPCNGNVVYQGEIFDPATQTTVNGQTCRLPFATDNVIPAGRVDPVAQNMLKYFPQPNQNTTQGINGDYYYVVPTPYPSTRIFGRIDYDFNSKNRLTSSIAVRDANSPVYSEWVCPVACYHDDTSDYSSQTSDVWSFSSNLVNEFRFSFNRQGSYLTPFSKGLGIPAAIGLQYAKADVFPNLTINGNVCCDSPYSGTNTDYVQNVYQPSDVVTLIRGKHVLHFGGELIMLEDNSTNWGNVDAGDFTFSGQYTQASQAATGSGAGWADFLLGDVQSWGATNSPLFGGRQKSPQVFVQDDIKLRPNLTVNVGLRYQIQEGWREVKNRMGDFDPTIFNTVSGNYGAMWFSPAANRTQAQANVYSGVLPRLGFAYSIKPTMVIRGGWGMYTTPWSVDQYGNAKGVGYGQSGSAQDQTNGITPLTTLSGPGNFYGTVTPLPYLNASTSATAYNGQNAPNYDPYHTPLTYLYSWSLGVQREFAHGIVSELAYVGKHGANMQFKGDINQVPVQNLSPNDNPTGRPYPQYQQIGGSTFNAISNYNSLQAQIKKRLEGGISFSAAYTWSKFLDDMDVSPFNGQGGTINFQNFHDPGSNYAPSNFDIRESLKSSIVYQLPFGIGQRWLNQNHLLDEGIGGWQVSAIVINQSGNPFTVVYNGPNNSYSQAGAWYPNVLRPAQYINKSINEWYDPTAFVTAANATFGNSRRNSLRAPGIDTTNFSMGKTFHFTEGVGLQLRADATNIFNHPDFDAPDGNFNDPVNLSTPGRPQGAGTISSTTVLGRTMQISARVSF